MCHVKKFWLEHDSSRLWISFTVVMMPDVVYQKKKFNLVVSPNTLYVNTFTYPQMGSTHYGLVNLVDKS